MDDEALEIKPPWSVASPVVKRVEEIVAAPLIETVPPNDDEALTMRVLVTTVGPVK